MVFFYGIMVAAPAFLSLLARPEEKENQQEDNGAKCDTQYFERYVVVGYLLSVSGQEAGSHMYYAPCSESAQNGFER